MNETMKQGREIDRRERQGFRDIDDNVAQLFVERGHQMEGQPAKPAADLDHPQRRMVTQASIEVIDQPVLKHQAQAFLIRMSIVGHDCSVY